jgi:hypothetical protein
MTDILLELCRDELSALCAALLPPNPRSTNGQSMFFPAHIQYTTWRSARLHWGTDYWLSKSEGPWRGTESSEAVDDTENHKAWGSTRRKSRFSWDIAPSIVDGMSSLVRYSASQILAGSITCSHELCNGTDR